MLSIIPYRYDLSSESPENKLIKETNFEIRQVVYNNSHAILLELYTLQRCYHTQHGLHINKKGKFFICNEIIKIADNLFQHPSKCPEPAKLSRITPLRSRCSSEETLIQQFPTESKRNPIEIIETDMLKVIYDLQDDANITFAHCISADFHDNRHMSRGVAVTFRDKFGRPTLRSCKQLCYFPAQWEWRLSVWTSDQGNLQQ